MKTVLLILSGCILTTLLMAQDHYLEIKTNRNDYIFYPPNTEFDIYNESGELAFTEKDLTKTTPIELEDKHTIQLSVSWGDGENTIEVQKAILNLRPPEKENDIPEQDYSQEWTSHEQPVVLKKVFDQNEDGTYDFTLEFEADIRFDYKNGEAKIREKGNILPMIGKYVAKTSKGYLKMSYQPKTKEYWYVFTDTYKKLIYK